MNKFLFSTKSKLLAILSLTLVLASCSDSDEQLPTNATVTITPASNTWTVVPNLQTDAEGNEYCVIVEDYYQDEFVTIMVNDSESRAIGNIELVVSLSLSGNTFSHYPLVELYDDLNGNYIPEPEELVSGGDDPLLTTHTEEHTGFKNLIVRMNLSCEYRAQLRVVAQGYSTSADFEVKAKGEE